MTGREAVDYIIVWMDKFQEELDKTHKEGPARKLREIAHELALLRIELYGEPR